jgi:hypothetical protein
VVFFYLPLGVTLKSTLFSQQYNCVLGPILTVNSNCFPTLHSLTTLLIPTYSVLCEVRTDYFYVKLINVCLQSVRLKSTVICLSRWTHYVTLVYVSRKIRGYWTHPTSHCHPTETNCKELCREVRKSNWRDFQNRINNAYVHVSILLYITMELVSFLEAVMKVKTFWGVTPSRLINIYR